MEAITTILLSFGLSADAFAVSVSSGFLIKHLNFYKCLKIGLFFGGFQALMPLIGWWVGFSFGHWIEAIDHWIAFGLLAGCGAKMIYEGLNADEEEKNFNPLDNGTLLVLAIATSIDALAVGISLALVNTALPLVVTTIGLITFFVCIFGVYLGHKFGHFFEDKIEIIGGMILITIGLKILREHLF